MADNWASWYQGGMTPPLALPGGGYVPAPLSTPQMSVEDMYQGIYAPPAVPQSLQTRPVQTVQINPQTGMPYSPSMSATASGGFGQGGNIAARGRAQLPMTASANAALGAIGNATGSIFATAPNQPAGSINAFKAQDRLPALPAGLPLGSGPQASARGSLGASASGGGSLMLKSPAAPGRGVDAPPDLSGLDLDDKGAQKMADSRRGPIISKGKVYYPGGKSPASAGSAAPRPQQQQQRGGGLMALLSGLMGGGQSGGGGLASMLGGGASSFGSSPSQGLAMTVNPGTSVGQTLSGMGFSDGAAVPAATIRNLEQRGYF